jgi:MFS transporter, ACS family, tartrate transporter
MAHPDSPSPLDRARTKAYWRLLPLLFFGYLIAYVDRSNVSILKLKMIDTLPGFDEGIFGFGMGIFFAGYCLLEIPGTLIVERWSARKWICRIMVTWGVFAALTALVTKPWHFYSIRFLLGLAEAGFYPGVIVYLTHWFPKRDRSRALAYFFMAGPLAQLVSPKITNLMLNIGTDETINGVLVHHPAIWGLVGWQWAYIAWGIPAVILGVIIFFLLTDRPAQARWLDDDEREALQAELAREKAEHPASPHMTVLQALSNPKVLTLTAAYFFVVTGNYGIEFFMPSILKSWYNLKSMDDVTSLVILPPIGSLIGQFLVGWSSDRTGERRLHAVLPIYFGASALVALVILQPPLWGAVALFTVAMAGLKAYLPAFWALPTLFLSQSAAAGSIGLINSVGNLGGWIGPTMMGWIETRTGSFRGGMTYLAVSMAISATIILKLGLGKRVAKPSSQPDPMAEVLNEPL